MNIAIIRGKSILSSEIECLERIQDEDTKFTIFTPQSAHRPKTSIEIKKLFSPIDLPDFPLKYLLLNILLGEAHTLRDLEKYLKKFDIVHSQETFFGFTHQAIQMRRRGEIKKIIVTCKETIPHNHEYSRKIKGYKLRSRESVDHYIAVTKKAQSALVKEGVSEEKITIVPYGIDTKVFCPENKKGKLKKAIKILCVSKLSPERGVEDLLSVFVEIYKKDKNIQLVFIGTGKLAKEFHGYKGVSIKNISHQKLIQEYQKADIVVVPSRSTTNWEEQFNMSLIEAMSCGLPVIATNTGTNKEICQDAALYYPERDTNKLGVLLSKLIYNKEARDDLGSIGRYRAVHFFDIQKVSSQIKSIYQKILCR